MENTNLSLSDLMTLKNIVAVACERGAFRAEEMSNVGQCYDRLNVWLTNMSQSAQEPTPDNTQSETPQGD
jgi:hypothetical protein